MQRADRGSAPGDGGLALHTRGDAGDAPSIAAFTNPDGQEPPLTTSTWNVSASGDWSDASDWSGGVPNSSTADATISEAGTYTDDIAAAESFTVGSVTLNEDLMTSFGTSSTAVVTGIDNLLDRLDRDEFDLVAIGRSLIVNPAWPGIVRRGALSELRPFNREALGELV